MPSFACPGAYRVAVLVAAWSWVSVAGAQERREGFSLDRHHPPPSVEDGLAMELPRTAGPLRPSAALVLDYAYAPLVLRDADGNQVGAIVSQRLAGHVVGALGLGRRLQISIDLPVVLWQTGESPVLTGSEFAEPSGLVLGDLVLGGAVWILGSRDGGPQLGLSLAVPLPSGSPEDLAGDDGLGLRAHVLGAIELEAITFAANAGVLVRPQRDYDSARIGPEIVWQAGALLPLGRFLRLSGEVSGATELRAGRKTTALEALFGARMRSLAGITAGLGAGPGLAPGVGTPDLRVVAFAGFSPPEDVERGPSDRDHDGLLDQDDRCPDDPEDRDGFEDEDGCPDPDNDRDGVLDRGDRCPLVAEDRDHFADADGCPEPDNDQDGLLDRDDRCPNEPETRNGVEDADGCPDLVRVVESQIQILQRIEFEVDSDVLLPVSFPILEEVAAVLRANAELGRIRVEGHTDSTASDEYNESLSQRRAESVVRWLTQHGIEAARLDARGFGESRPIDTNDTDAGRQRNRRVEFHILGNEEEVSR